jgi:hypothetical protein
VLHGKIVNLSKRKFCLDCSPFGKHNTRSSLITSLPTQEEVVKLFWSKVDVGQPNDCWEWKAGKSKNGRGQFWYQGRNRIAYQIAYLLTYGKIPDGKSVCHNCPTGDNPACCNPAHLWLGTHQENMQDMIQKRKRTMGV